MEYNVKKESFSFSEKQIQTSAEQSFDTEISLPDYCSDIRKILRCLVTVNINSCQINGDRVAAEGENVIRVLYIGESGKPECYEHTMPFSKYAEIRDAGGECSCSVRGKVEYVNCRAVSQRRISVSGNIGLIFSIIQMKNLSLPSSAEGAGIETRRENVNTDMEISFCDKIFEMGETVSLGENQPPVSSVVCAEACAVTEMVKAVDNKLLIKGEMQVFVLYCADSESRELVRFRHTMPISQVFQVENIDKDCICDADVSVCGVNITPCADSNGKNTLMEISVKAEANIRAYRNTDLTVVTDCYSTSCEMKCEYKSIDFPRHLFTYKETKQVRATVDLASLNVSGICEGFCKKTEGSAVNKNGKIEGNGNSLIGILYKDSGGEYGYCERSVDFGFECQGGEGNGEITSQPIFSTGDISCTSVGTDKAEIKLSVNIFMPVYEAVSKKICTHIEPDEEHPKKKNDWALTVYFCDGGEQLWDIAERYNTTVDKIKEENELTQEAIAEKTILMIPN